MNKLILLFLLSTSLLALNSIQLAKVKTTYNIGNRIKAKDGTTFGVALASIMGQESSWGYYVIGDKIDETGKLKSLYDSSLGNFQIKLHTAKETILKNPTLYKKYSYMINKDKSTYIEYTYNRKKYNYYNKIIKSKKWNKLAKNKNKKAIRVLKWANKELLYHKRLLNKLKANANKDIVLINVLMNNFSFSAEIAAYYLRKMYHLALRRGYSKRTAYIKAIGRYNGGWHNKRYYKKIKERALIVKHVLKL